MNPKSEGIREILINYRSHYASFESNGELWGHDTCLGDGEEELKEANFAIRSKLLEEIMKKMPKKVKTKMASSYDDRISYERQIIEDSYNQSIDLCTKAVREVLERKGDI